MTRFELLAVMYALEALLDNGNPGAAQKLIKRVIEQAELSTKEK